MAIIAYYVHVVCSSVRFFPLPSVSSELPCSYTHVVGPPSLEEVARVYMYACILAFSGWVSLPLFWGVPV